MGKSISPRRDVISTTPRIEIVGIQYDPTGYEFHPYSWTSYVGFGPSADETSSLALLADGIIFMVPIEETFSIDIGPNPEIGAIVPIDVDLDIQGIPIHLSVVSIML